MGNLTEPTKYQRGLAKIREAHGESGVATVEALNDIAPALAQFIAEFAYADVISRPGLDMKTREMATVATLVALGNAAPQLKIHIHCALNVGCTHQEIIELMVHMAVYAGFPAALNGIAAARDVFNENRSNTGAG